MSVCYNNMEPGILLCALAGLVVGLAFAHFTTSRWGDAPCHVWPAWLEYAYAATALALLAWMARDHRTSVYPVSATVVACGAYHLAIGIAKATAHHP